MRYASHDHDALRAAERLLRDNPCTTDGRIAHFLRLPVGAVRQVRHRLQLPTSVEAQRAKRTTDLARLQEV